MSDVNFNISPPLGTVLMVQGQRYVLVGTEPFRRNDGTSTTLLKWASHCPVCADAFVASTPLKTRYISRRCPKHHRAGVPVARSRKIVVKRRAS